MNKLLSAFGCIAALLAVVSCGKESSQDLSALDTKLVPVTVEASVPETRVSLSQNTPVWVKGDRIGVFTTDAELCPAFTASTGGSSRTTFTGQKPEWSRLKSAFYPYDANATWGQAGISLTLPGIQGGKAQEAVMVAAGNEDDDFVFLNACCLVKLNLVSSLDVRKVELVRSDRVSGAFTVLPGSSPLQITVPASISLSDRKVVYAGNQVLTGDVVLAVLPSSSQKLEMALTDSRGKVAFINTTFKSGKPYEAGRIKNLGTLSANLAFYDAALIDETASNQL